MSYFNVIYNLIKIQIEYNPPVTRFFLAILIFTLWYTLNLYYIKNKKIVTIEDYEIKSKFLLLFILGSFIILYILGFFYIRLLNMSKTFNVYDIINKYITIIKSASYFSIFSSICLICSMFLLSMFILSWYKQLLLKYYLQLHFLIISYYPNYGEIVKDAPIDWFDDEKPYESLRWLFSRTLRRIMSFVSNVFKIIVPGKTSHIPTNSSSKEISRILQNLSNNIPPTIKDKILTWINKNFKLYGLFLLLILFVYDLILNQGLITKVFYFLPITFLYYLLCKWHDVLWLYEQRDEIWITTFIYANIIFTDDPNYMYHANGVNIPTDDLQELLEITIPSKHKYP